MKWLSRARLCDPVGCSLHQAPPSMGFSKQEYWSGLTLRLLKNHYQETEFLPRQKLKKLRRARDQIAFICWIMEKAREFQKNIYFCFIDCAKAFYCVDHNKLWKTLRDGNTRPPDLPREKSSYRSGSNN